MDGGCEIVDLQQRTHESGELSEPETDPVDPAFARFPPRPGGTVAVFMGKVLTRGSNAFCTASAKRFALNTSANIKLKAASKAHHTIGSRAISSRAALIIVPKLIIEGSTPTPT